MHLFNPTPITLQSHYGGIVYTIPPGKRLTLKTLRLRGDFGNFDTHVSEDVAAKLYADLSPLGCVLLDDDHPLPTDEHGRVGRRAFITFVQGLIDDFNDLNADQAAKGARIFAIPKGYKELKRHLDRLVAEEGDGDEPPEFMSKKELQDIRQRGEVTREQAIKSIMRALETGSPEAVMAAATAAQRDMDSSAEDRPGQFRVRSAPGKKMPIGPPAAGRKGKRPSAPAPPPEG